MKNDQKYSVMATYIFTCKLKVFMQLQEKCKVWYKTNRLKSQIKETLFIDRQPSEHVQHVSMLRSMFTNDVIFTDMQYKLWSQCEE